MPTILDDLRHAWRTLRARPGFALTSVFTLALAIGANVAIFSAVNAVLLGPLPYRDPARLVTIAERRATGDQTPFSIPDFRDLVAENRTLDEAAAFFQWSANVTGGTAERLQGMRATVNLFTMLGASAARGRLLEPPDETGGRIAILSDGLWRSRFGGAPEVVGQEIVLNGEGYTIVGVLPPWFVFPIRDADLIAPFSLATDPRRAARESGFLRVLGRLKPGVDPAAAAADLDAVMARIGERHPAETAGRVGTIVTSWHDALVGATRPMLLLLQGAVVLMLLVACANLGNLTLAAALAREREFAIRLALGAGRVRLVRHLLAESALLAVAGTAIGVALAAGSASALQAFVPLSLARAGARAAIDARVLVFTAGVTIVAAIAFGVAPAWHASGARPADTLRAGGRGMSTGAGGARRWLVGLEVALAAALVILVGLLVRSFQNMQSVDPGFRPDHVLTVRLSLPRVHYRTRAELLGFHDRLSPRLAALPGVERAAAANVIPLNNYLATANFWFDARPKPPPERIPEAHYRVVSPGYFAALQIPVIAGRGFTDRDTSGSEPVAIVNASLARRFWGAAAPLGEYLALEDGANGARRVRIVGVAGDVKHFGLDAETTADVHVPMTQVPESVVQWVTNNLYFVVRTSTDPMSLESLVRREVQAVDRDVPASNLRPLDDLLESSIAPRRFNLRLMAIFGLAALLLASSGVFAVTAQSVGERRREIGIRTALGAPAGHVVRRVIADAAGSVAIGLAVGAVVARIGARATADVLFGVTAGDPATYAIAIMALACVGALAAYWPARRARRIDPIVALRSQ